MTRVLAGAGVVALVALAVGSFQHLHRDRQYRDLLARGEAALADGAGYAAIEAFSGALALRPDSMAAHLRRGEAYQAQRRHAEAVRDLREAVRLAPRAMAPLVALADLYAEMGDPAQAAEYYARAAGLHDGDATLLYRLALARYRAGSPAAAVDPLRRLAARPEASSAVLYLLGLVERDTQNVEAAAAALERAVSLDPSLAPAREELADLYRALGRPADELIQLQALAALDEQVERHVAVALAEARLGRFDQALATLAAAAAAAPADSQVELAAGRVHLARAEHPAGRAAVAAALQALERALGGSARRSEGLALYGRALYLDGNVAAAERILREAVATSPIHREAFGFLADAAERLGDHGEARRALASLDALEGDTASAEVRTGRARRLGVLALRAGDPAAAVEHLTHAVQGGRDDAATLGVLAEAEWLSGAADAARATLARALARDPAHPDLLRLRRRIR